MSSSGIPQSGSALTEDEAEDLLRCICFKTGPPRALGVEVEWLVHELRDPRLPVPPQQLASAVDTVRSLPLASAITLEPGGQLELSSPPAASLMGCVDTLSADLRAVRDALFPSDSRSAVTGSIPGTRRGTGYSASPGTTRWRPLSIARDRPAGP